MIRIATNATPSVLSELVYKLKVKDVMTKNVFTAQRQTSLREIQRLMRENKISGVPILDEDRLVGMVSVDDIIRALDQGYIDSPAEVHMTKKVVVLEDDMPLSFGITYFEKYPFGRFPVIDRDRFLVGMMTSRDVTSGLLLEMNNALERMEKELNQHSPGYPDDQIHKVFLIQQYDYENAGRASTEIKKTLQERGVDRKTLRCISVASYELEMNLVNHSLGGRLVFTCLPDRVVIEAIDEGPGIPDLDKAMTEGFSTANDWIRSLGFGAGMGLPNTKRVSDDFEIQSTVGKGTEVRAVVYLDRGELP